MKVCFAGCEDSVYTVPALSAGVKHILSSAYLPMMRMFNKRRADIDQSRQLYSYIRANTSTHILDSGLFSLMFGAGKKHASRLKNSWQDMLVDFIHESGFTGICVEADMQKILGVKESWKGRERFKKQIKNPIINVFHLEDKKDGLDRLIEFSDYIALAGSELRITGMIHRLPMLVDYIHNKKPGIKIHLLGCTAKSVLKKVKEAETCDSISWKSWLLYGPKKYSMSNDYLGIYRNYVSDYEDRSDKMKALMGRIYVSALAYKKEYQDICGLQN